jgi:hypothetical protein
LGERWGINLYQFVRNNSVNTIDSDGRIAVLPIMIAGGVCGVFFTPATVNAPGPNDPVYPALTVDEVCVNALCGATFAGGIGIVSSKSVLLRQPLNLHSAQSPVGALLTFSRIIG